MKLTEHIIEQGEITIKKDEKILSFGIDSGKIYFWGIESDNKTDNPPTKYVVLNQTDKVPENLQHVATLVEGIKPKHIFMEYIAPAQQAKRDVSELMGTIKRTKPKK